jgi:hypothetical protein
MPLTTATDLRGGTTDNIRELACALTTTSSVVCWGVGFQPYPVPTGPANVAALGNLDSGIVRVLTNDGMYHIGTVTRAPNCGSLQ